MKARQGVALLTDLARLSRSQWHSLDRLRELQRRLLNDQLHHARRTVPYYRTSWPRDPIEQLCQEGFQQLPLVRRDSIQASPESFLSEVGDRRSWKTSFTSGSTGRPLESFFDPVCWRQSKYAFKLRRLLASGWRPGHRLVIVEALDDDESEQHARTHALPGESLLGLALGSRSFLSLFDPPENHLEHYRRIRPQHIYAPPSYLAALARVWNDRERDLVPLRSLMTSGEWAHPNLRQRLERAFGAPVLDVYGSTECKEVAWQCKERGSLHVNMESVLVEIVDPDGRTVEFGQPGEIVLTSLLNRAMPLIRYATQDRAILSDAPCGCGRQSLTLDSLEGRTVDELSLPDGRRVSPYALTTAIEHCPGIHQYRIVQSARDRLEIEVASQSEAPPEVLARQVQDALRPVVGTQIELRIRLAERLTQEPSGKCRPVSQRRLGEVGSGSLEIS